MKGIEQFIRQLYSWALVERTGRKRYVLTNVKNGIVGFSIAFAPLFVVFLLPDLTTDAPAFIATLIAVFAAVGMVTVYIITSIARLRDMEVNPAWIIAGLIPYANIIFFVWLAFTEGGLAREKRTGVKKRRSPRVKKDDTKELVIETSEDVTVQPAVAGA